MEQTHHDSTSEPWCVCYLRPQLCHNEVHAILTESELARDWNTPEKLRAHPQLARVFAWLRGKPPDFHARSRRNIRMRRKRR